MIIASVGAALRPARRCRRRAALCGNLRFVVPRLAPARFASLGRAGGPPLHVRLFLWSTAPVPCFVTYGHQRKLLNITRSESFTRPRVMTICLPSGENE